MPDTPDNERFYRPNDVPLPTPQNPFASEVMKRHPSVEVNGRLQCKNHGIACYMTAFYREKAGQPPPSHRKEVDTDYVVVCMVQVHGYGRKDQMHLTAQEVKRALELAFHGPIKVDLITASNEAYAMMETEEVEKPKWKKVDGG